MRRFLVCLFLVMLFSISIPSTFAEDASKLNVKETVVCDFVRGDQYHVSNNLASLAVVKEVSGGKVVIFNGKEQKKYREIKSLLLSPNGKSVAYIATAKGKSFVVLKGKAGKKYDGIVSDSLIFTGDSKHLLYVAEVDGKYIVVDNKKEGVAVGGLKDLTVAKQGGSFAYHASEGLEGDPFGGWLVVGTKHKHKYPSPYFIQFSPNGKRMFFGTMDQTGGSTYVDEKSICTPGGIGAEDFVFSPDSKSWGYCANFQIHLISAAGERETPPKRIVFINGKEKGTFSHASGMVFAEKSSSYAFFAKKNDVLSVYFKGKKYSELHGNMDDMRIFLSPNGKRIAVKTSKTLYLNKKSVAGYEPDNPFLFNSKNEFCQIMNVQDRIIVQVDGKQRAVVDAESGKDLTFSPSCSKLAFEITVDGKKAIAVGEERTGEYDMMLYGQEVCLSRGLFSIGRMAEPEGIFNGLKTSVLDSRFRSPEAFGLNLYQPGFVFKSDNLLVFYAIKDKKVVKVEVTIP